MPNSQAAPFMVPSSGRPRFGQTSRLCRHFETRQVLLRIPGERAHRQFDPIFRSEIMLLMFWWLRYTARVPPLQPFPRKSRWPPRIPGSRRRVGQHVSSDDVLGRGSGQGKGHPFSALSAAAQDLTSEPLPPTPFRASVGSGPEGAPSASVSALSMLSVITADIGFRLVFFLLQWPFPSSVAGMACLCAGKFTPPPKAWGWVYTG